MRTPQRTTAFRASAAAAAIGLVLLGAGCSTDGGDKDASVSPGKAGEVSESPSAGSETPTESTETPAEATETPTEAAEPGADPAAGELIEGTGYTYNVPKGWGVPPETPGFSPDSMAADLKDSDGFADNINVLVSPAGSVKADDASKAAESELSAGGASDVKVHPNLTVAGSESAHVSASMSLGSAEYTIEQFYVPNDSDTFVVTFSFSTSVSEADRAALAESVLASWAWSD